MTKFNSKKVIIDGIQFDSKIEGDYHLYLKEQKKIGLIVGFSTQPKYLILPKFEKNGEKFRDIYYVADFLIQSHDGSEYIVDIKGMPTETSLLKRKLYCNKYDVPLKRLCKYKGERIDYFDNRKRILSNKKIKKSTR